MNINKKSHSAEDAFFTVLDCAKAYCDYKNSDSEDGEELSEEESAKVVAYAVYLERLNKQTIKETGEGL